MLTGPFGEVMATELVPKVAASWRAALAPWLVPLGILALWQLAAQAGWLSSRILPAPSAVAAAAWSLAVSGELWLHLRVSAARLWGLLLGGGLGLALGLLNGASRRAETLLDTTLQMIRNIPVLALIPLFILVRHRRDRQAGAAVGGRVLSRLSQHVPRHPLGGSGADRDGPVLWPERLAPVPRRDPARRAAVHAGGPALRAGPGGWC